MRRVLRKSDGFLLVATDQGDIVEMAVELQGRADDGAGVPLPGLCFIPLVSVAPQRWSAGIGGRIVAALLDAARSYGYANFQLWTHATNGRAQRLCEGRGFRHSDLEWDDDLGAASFSSSHRFRADSALRLLPGRLRLALCQPPVCW